MLLTHAKVVSNYKHTLTSVHSAREAVLIQRQRDRTSKTLCPSRNRREDNIHPLPHTTNPYALKKNDKPPLENSIFSTDILLVRK